MPLLELKDISFAYPGHAPVLAGASLRLAAGERISIVGPNGAGKSTLLKLAVGLLKPSAGEVIAFGRARATEKDFYEVRCRIGYVFQDPDDQLFCPTVAEDIAFGPLNLGKSRSEALAIVEEVLARIGCLHLRDRITHRLSGGEKRLVTLATVLAMEPDVLLLDEPTNALDPENEARLIEILQSLPQACILISHDAEFRAKIAPKGYTLQNGTLQPLA
ncbi:energy-coupling factor ABC transporter ATP-binding protein [Arenibacterium sp. LLYu02]|uniref:energy-coupling factor ABC transporter ATP-binding protein n=1 Tax=Arenibacterium sp. LLYu02 TaxID=3404132 RepID=UPI003B213BC5